MRSRLAIAPQEPIDGALHAGEPERIVQLVERRSQEARGLVGIGQAADGQQPRGDRRDAELAARARVGRRASSHGRGLPDQCGCSGTSTAQASMMPTDAHLAELVVARVEPRLRRPSRDDLGQRARQRDVEQRGGLRRIGVRAADRLGDDLVDDAEREQIRRRELERRRPPRPSCSESRHRIAAQPSGGITL